MYLPALTACERFNRVVHPIRDAIQRAAAAAASDDGSVSPRKAPTPYPHSPPLSLSPPLGRAKLSAMRGSPKRRRSSGSRRRRRSSKKEAFSVDFGHDLAPADWKRRLLSIGDGSSGQLGAVSLVWERRCVCGGRWRDVSCWEDSLVCWRVRKTRAEQVGARTGEPEREGCAKSLEGLLRKPIQRSTATPHTARLPRARSSTRAQYHSATRRAGSRWRPQKESTP